jgi:WD40 repeat protein
VTGAAFSPDGTRVVTVSEDMTARVWDAATGKPLGIPLTHQAMVTSAAFSPDGTHVVTVSGDGTGTARVWEIPLDDTPWEALAARCPFVITGGAFEQRIPLAP